MASASIPLTNLGSGYTIVTQVIPSSTAEQNSSQTLSPLQKFLKGEPKALGTVQIMNGILICLIDIVKTLLTLPHYGFIVFGFTFWASLFYILTGIMTVSASNRVRPCEVKSAMGVNILSVMTTAVCIIIYFLGSMFTRDLLLIGILLIFSLLQFAISITISVFACKATCSKKPALDIITVVPNPEDYLPVSNSFPVRHAQPEIIGIDAAAMNNPPEGSPPAYSELKHESDN